MSLLNSLSFPKATSLGIAVSVSVSAQDGIVALRKTHTRSAPSRSSLPKVALETVPIFVWLNTDRSWPWRVECRPLPFQGIALAGRKRILSDLHSGPQND